MPAPTVIKYALQFGENGSTRYYDEFYTDPAKFMHRKTQLINYFEGKEIPFVVASIHSYIPGDVKSYKVVVQCSLWNEPKAKRELNVEPKKASFA